MRWAGAIRGAQSIPGSILETTQTSSSTFRGDLCLFVTCVSAEKVFSHTYIGVSTSQPDVDDLSEGGSPLLYSLLASLSCLWSVGFHFEK